MAKIELGREYKTRGGGKAVVYRDDGGLTGRELIGAVWWDGHWRHNSWTSDGRCSFGRQAYDLILPRTVMVPVEVPEWANYVTDSGDGFGRRIEFWEDRNPTAAPIDDWIASLGGEK